ncbi:MAG: YybS family protein [Dictyoglomaceae bacterium]|nr:YybS family protein [Dictyoglomaceae bacterium]
MINKSTKAIVEGSLLAGIAVIIFWLSYFIFPFIFLCSLPFLFLSYKWGFKISLISLIVSLVISSLFLTFLNALFLYFPSGILGIVLGIGIKRNLSLGKLFLLGGSINLILEVLTILGGMLLFKIPFEKVLGIDIMKESWKNSLNFIKSFLDENSIKDLMGNQDQFFNFLNIIIPSLLILSSFFQVVINYWIAQKIFIRFKLNIKPLPSLDTLRIPKILWNILFVILIFSFILSLFTPLGINIFNNGVFLLQFLLILEGCFVLWSLLKKYIYSKIMKIFIIFLFIFNPFLTFLLFIVGIIDIFYPIREKFLLREKL